MPLIDVTTLTDGEQRAEDVAARLVAWLEATRESLDLALYDVRLPGAVGDDVAGAIRAARDRGVRIRIMFNQDEREEGAAAVRAPAAAHRAGTCSSSSGCPAPADPGLARPHAPQVRGA